VAERTPLDDFERAVLPHLNAAYNLARWLTRNDADAADVVQEACLRAFKYFGGFAGGSGKPWLLSIVRHTCFTWLAKNRPAELAPLDDMAIDDLADAEAGAAATPESGLLAADERVLLAELLAGLPAEFREIVVLRELEELSYRAIAEVTGLPVGTVMSRLARARGRLRAAWRRRQCREDGHGS